MGRPKGSKNKPKTDATGAVITTKAITAKALKTKATKPKPTPVKRVLPALGRPAPRGILTVLEELAHVLAMDNALAPLNQQDLQALQDLGAAMQSEVRGEATRRLQARDESLDGLRALAGKTAPAAPATPAPITANGTGLTDEDLSA